MPTPKPPKRGRGRPRITAPRIRKNIYLDTETVTLLRAWQRRRGLASESGAFRDLVSSVWRLVSAEEEKPFAMRLRPKESDRWSEITRAHESVDGYLRRGTKKDELIERVRALRNAALEFEDELRR